MKKVSTFIGTIVFIFSAAPFLYALDDMSAGAAAQQSVTATVAPTAPAVPVEKPAPIDTANMSEGYGKTPLSKLTRGVLNMSTFFFEIPAGVMRVSNEKDNAFIGGTIGLAQGFCACILRAVTAVYDTVTFPIPPYNKPIMEPEYTVQSLENANK